MKNCEKTREILRAELDVLQSVFATNHDTNIGRKVRIKNWTKKEGKLYKGTLVITGCQTDYAGVFCYRVVPEEYPTCFGTIVRPDNMIFID